MKMTVNSSQAYAQADAVNQIIDTILEACVDSRAKLNFMRTIATHMEIYKSQIPILEANDAD